MGTTQGGPGGRQEGGQQDRARASSPSERECGARCIYNTALKGTRPPINHTVSLAGVKIATWHRAHACAWNRAGPAKPSAPRPRPPVMPHLTIRTKFPPPPPHRAPGWLPAPHPRRGWGGTSQMEPLVGSPAAPATRPRLLTSGLAQAHCRGVSTNPRPRKVGERSEAVRNKGRGWAAVCPQKIPSQDPPLHHQGLP